MTGRGNGAPTRLGGDAAQSRPVGGKPTARFDYDVEPACTTASPGAGIGCVGATTACPPGSTRFFLYRRPAGTTQTFGRFGPAACLPVGPDGTPVSTGPTLADVAAGVDRYVQHLPLPGATLHEQPVGGNTLVQLPTYYFTDPIPTRSYDLDVLGTAVHLTATPTWHWHLGDYTDGSGGAGDDGAEQVTTDPGGPYPDGDVTATYHTRGDRHPSVDVVWTATFTAIGYGGPFPVTGDVTSTGEPITVHVLEARAELVHPA